MGRMHQAMTSPGLSRGKPVEFGNLDADLARIVTYDDGMAAAANQLGLTVTRPT
jgi:hypothetical protein